MFSLTSQRKLKIRISFFDFLWIVLSPFIALRLRGSQYLDFGDLPNHPSPTLVYASTTILITIFILNFLKLDEGLNHLFSAQDAIRAIVAIVISIVISTVIVFAVSRLQDVPRSVPLIYGLVLTFGLLTFRLINRNILERRVGATILKNNNNVNPFRDIIIIGLDQFAISTIRLLERQRPITTRVISAFSFNGKLSGRRLSNVRIHDDFDRLGLVIDEYQVHGIFISEVWVSDSSVYFSDEIFNYIECLTKPKGVVVKKISDALSLSVSNCDDFNGVGKINFDVNNNPYISYKRTLDVFGALLLFIVLSPIFIFAIIVTWIDLGRPIFFWQERQGFIGSNFRIYKIRTLGRPFEENGSPIDYEDRLSDLGRVLRRLRLDEIPQLLNILAGDMSGIGPRPLLPRDQPQNKYMRLLVRPGITGWAQVNGGELLTAEEKNALDCWYVSNISLALDIHIILLTFVVVLRGVRRNEAQIEAALNWWRDQS
jgi:lipopolysaccharide/colanic/teichoic acid biosynthesis glycosyltransferase